MPGVVELFVEHVGLHFILLLVEGIDRLEEVVVELGIFLLLFPKDFFKQIWKNVEVEERKQCSNNCHNGIDSHQRQQLRRDKIITILYSLKSEGGFDFTDIAGCKIIGKVGEDEDGVEVDDESDKGGF